MSYSSSTRTTKTYEYSSSSGPDGPKSTVTEITTTIGPDGRKTESRKTTTGTGTPEQLKQAMLSGNLGGGENRISSTRNIPEETGGKRYSMGWSSQRENRFTPAGKPMVLVGKTFDEIKAQCQRENRLFEDPDFTATDYSISFSGRRQNIEWKRPHEICDNPELFVAGASRFDINQGALGDCWLLAAIASLTLYEDLLYRVVPPNQTFNKSKGYCGIFKFKFWCYGEWRDVFIDDRLPVRNGRLVYLHSKEKNEFWTALMEKAYAKLVGCYEALKGGSAAEAMEDFTGGVTELIELRGNQKPSNLWTILTKAFERSSMMGCSIEAVPGQTEARLASGLICGHAYSLTSVKEIEVSTKNKSGKIPMVRIRNPWGNDAEWKGAWSDGSREWQFIKEDERKRIGLVFSDDGEFWMSFADFQTNFHKLEICNLGPESPLEDNKKRKWEGTKQNGAWKKNVNAGGCRNFLDTFWTNPQYRVTVTDPDDEDDEDLGTIIVGLMQIGRRKLRKEGKDLLTIGYVIYELKDKNSDPLSMEYFKYNQSKAKSPSFINIREVCGRHKLKPGNYCIIPSTFEPNHEADFLVRIYSEHKNVSHELDEQTSMVNIKPNLPAVQPEAEDQMMSAFKSISGDDLEVDAYELKVILDNAFKREFKFDGFSSETCRSMVALMDNDRSGKLGFDEFKKLWQDLRLWKTIFKKYDTDKSGNFSSYEMRNVFHAIGFRISNSTFNALVKRYTHKDGCIYFDDFVHCVVRMRTMFDIFKEMSEGRADRKAVFTLDCFIQTTMYS